MWFSIIFFFLFQWKKNQEVSHKDVLHNLSEIKEAFVHIEKMQAAEKEAIKTIKSVIFGSECNTNRNQILSFWCARLLNLT